MQSEFFLVLYFSLVFYQQEHQYFSDINVFVNDRERINDWQHVIGIHIDPLELLELDCFVEVKAPQFLSVLFVVRVKVGAIKLLSDGNLLALFNFSIENAQQLFFEICHLGTKVWQYVLLSHMLKPYICLVLIAQILFVHNVGVLNFTVCFVVKLRFCLGFICLF